MHEVFLGVEDDFVGAELLQPAPLLFRARTGDDIGPGNLGQLNAAHPDAAAGTEDQYLLARRDLTVGGHHAVRGTIGNRQRRRLLKAHILGNPHELVRTCVAQLRETAVDSFTH